MLGGTDLQGWRVRARRGSANVSFRSARTSGEAAAGLRVALLDPNSEVGPVPLNFKISSEVGAVHGVVSHANSGGGGKGEWRSQLREVLIWWVLAQELN